MNRMLFSCVGVCLVAAGCTSHPPVLTRDTGHLVASVKTGAPEESRKFDIPAEDARVALNEFSRQANVQLPFDFTAFRGLQTHAVEGMWQPSDALKAMLKDTGFVANVVNERTWAIGTGR